LKVITDHQDVCRGNLVEIAGCQHAAATEVHPGERPEKKGTGATYCGLTDLALKSLPPSRRAGAFCQDFQNIESDIVTSSLVLPARISEPNQQFHEGSPLEIDCNVSESPAIAAAHQPSEASTTDSPRPVASSSFWPGSKHEAITSSSARVIAVPAGISRSLTRRTLPASR